VRPRPDLHGSLSLLETSRLIRGLPDVEAAFAFKHSMVQQVAYESMLVQDRRDLHLRVGEILESELGKAGPELADVLSSHFEQAGRPDQALRYARLAGEDSLRRFATAEAAQQFGRAIALAGEAGLEGAELVSLYQGRGRALELGADYPTADALYQEMQRLGRETGDGAMELAGLTGAASLYAVPTILFDLDRALTLADRALEISRELGDPEGETRALWLKLLAETRRDPEAAVRHGEAALELARKHGLSEQQAFILNDIGSNYFAVGQPGKAVEAITEAEPIWRRLENLPMLADNLATSALILTFAGRYPEAAEKGRASLSISDRTGNLWGQSYGRVSLAIGLYGQGELGPAVQEMTRCIELAEPAGFLYPLTSGRAVLALAYGRAGALDLAQKTAEKVGEVERAHPMPGHVGAKSLLAWVAALRGDLAEAKRILEGAGLMSSYQSISLIESPFAIIAALIDYNLAAEDYRQALEVILLIQNQADSMGASMFSPYFKMSVARCRIGLGDVEEGRIHLEAALQQLRRQGVENGMWEAEGLLADLAARDGRMEDARSMYRSSAGHARGIASGLAPLGLDSRFLALPTVRDILDRAGEPAGG
jgi:tetratricopeptide (TPR) repeat protein